VSPVSILLVDDNIAFLTLLAGLFSDVEASNTTIVGMLRDYDEVVRYAQILRPDVIVHDLGLPKLRGLPNIRKLREATPNVGIVALTLLDSQRYTSKAIRSGADEVLYKGRVFWDLVPAIERVFTIRNRHNGAPLFTGRQVVPSRNQK
jgi:DNA-binding NarL/FixJ family response regulator